MVTRGNTLVKSLPLRRRVDHLRGAALRLAAYNDWPLLRLAEDVVVADRGPWLTFLRQATDDELLYALRFLQARTRLVDAPLAIRRLLDGELL